MLFQQIAQNKRRTIYVLAAFILLVAVVGAAVGELFFGSVSAGLVAAGILGVIYFAVTWSQSTEIVMNMNHAREIHAAAEYPKLWHVVEDMALAANVPMPRVFIIDDPSPNAFATGNRPGKAAVAVTQGLLDRLNREELEGVIAHEVSHIRNYDIRLQTISLALVSVVSVLVSMGMRFFWWGGGRGDRDDEDSGNGVLTIVLAAGAVLVLMLGPLAASLAQMALSRNREYLADASGVELTRNPQGLISALQKITDSEPMKAADASSAGLYIANPFKKRSWTHLFDIHPPVADRIKRLEEM